MVWCAWRLENASIVICGSESPNDNDGMMVNGLRRITDLYANKIKLDLPSFDLTIKLENTYSLKIFCNSTNKDENYENYTLSNHKNYYTVEGGNYLSKE